MPWLWGSLHPSDTKHSTFTASPGGNRLTAVPQGSSTPNFRSLVHNCFFCLCFRLLHSTGHTDLNVDSELHKLGKAAWTCLDAPSWKEQTGSVHVSPADKVNKVTWRWEQLGSFKAQPSTECVHRAPCGGREAAVLT